MIEKMTFFMSGHLDEMSGNKEIEAWGHDASEYGYSKENISSNTAKEAPQNKTEEESKSHS